jgi:site-specific recombinase XerC
VSNRSTWGPKTVGRRLTTLRSFARWAKVDCENLAEFKAPTPARPVPHPLPEGIAGVHAMIAVAKNDRQRAMLALCGLCGLRLHEALAVRPVDVNVGDMTVRVHGKGQKMRDVPLSAEAWHALLGAVTSAVIESRPTVVDYADRFARKVVTNCGQRAGLSRPVSSHDLRATFLTAVYNKTKDLRAAQELAGHASSNTTETYTGVVMATMRGAVEGL